MIESHPLFKEASTSSRRAYYEGWLVASTYQALTQIATRHELETIVGARLGKLERASWS